MGSDTTNKHIRFLAVAAASVMLFMVLFSGIYIVMEADHDCEGEHCHICETLEQCHNALSRIAPLPARSITSTASLTLLISICFCHIQRFSQDTPVSNKVRMND
ncbi:MAG: hypothetical protein K5745_04470 [Saccharofermentans sp.]|nr:hypothetical protein [Saccharofermentans sp.]